MLTDYLNKAMEKASDKCTSCNKSGRPITIRNISFNRILSPLNDFVKIDCLFVTQLTIDSILDVIDVHFGYTETKPMIKREMDNESKAFE